MHQAILQEFITTVVEGVHEYESTRLSRLCVNAFKAALTRSKQFEPNVIKAIFNDSIIVGGSIAGHLEFRIAFITDDNPMGIQMISGEHSAAPDGSSVIGITVGVPLKWVQRNTWKRAMSAYVSQIKGVIRHEVEHAQQSRDKRLPSHAVAPPSRGNDLMRLKQWARYALQIHEIEAKGVELYKKAKMAHVDIDYAVDQAVRSVTKNLNIRPEIVDSIMEPVRLAWSTYIKKRFPSAKFKDT